MHKYDIWPEKHNVNYDKLKITDEGVYSITRSKDSKKTIEFMKKSIEEKDLKTLTCTDLTGNVGGDTIRCAMNFGIVHSVEYNEVNFSALSNNISIYGLDNVTLHFNDSTKIFDWPTDVLYIDPPWGGPDYKRHESLDLYLGDIRIDLYVYSILKRRNRPKYIFLKLPKNYNFKRFTTYTSCDMKKYYIICLK
jgi:hypothetical protein